MNKIWKINEKPPKEFLERFPEYSRLTLQLLWDRNLKSQKAIDEFFNPDYDEDLHDPFLMLGMKKSVNRIEKAIKNKEKITIFGDYDADGVCGTAVLSETLKFLGNNPSVYIPDRNKEGYGLNLKAVEELANNKISLIITVDCGITDFDEIRLANKFGIDVIITDHHELSEKIPSAYSIINPCQKGEIYPFKELAAAGVAFKLAQALLKSKNHEAFEKWLLDLVAIATVTDSMPLIGENRTLVKYGLVVLAQTKRLGLQELMKIARIKPNFNRKVLTTNLDAYILGFIIGPRLNAAGRMDHANTAYELLITSLKEEAEVLAKRLNEQNQERQRLTERIVDEAEKRIGEEKLIFEGDNNWPIGIVGLISGQLTDRHFRPSIIFQKMESQSKGSARSIASFNIIEAISKCHDLLEDYGGHPGAAGFTILNKNLDKFKKKLLEIAEKEIKEESLVPVLNIDLEIDPAELNFDIYEEIQKFAPFGEGNIKPLFLMKNLKVVNFRKVGNSCNHLKMYLKRTKGFQAIGFGLADFCDMIKEGDEVDVVFELTVDNWNGTSELQLKIIDLKKV